MVHDVNLTRGASHFGIRRYRVFVPQRVLLDYAEPDPSLGFNVAGQILRVLARHAAEHPGGGPNNIINVGARRCHDGQAVELRLKVVHLRQQGHATLLLYKLGDSETSG